MRELPPESIDLLLTDPPYGYSFLGKDWDKAVPKVDIWRECHRLLKPGSFAFVMSAPRLDCLSKMALNLTEAGFEIGFSPIYWAYHSGFPKSLDISKVIDRRLGLKREIAQISGRQKSALCWGKHYDGRREIDPTLPASDDAKRLSGAYAGFQPKPAVEVIIVAMKPLSEKSHTDQALKNGKGVTWLKDCSIPAGDGYPRFPSNLLCCDQIFGEDSYMFDLDRFFYERIGKLPENLKDSFPFLFCKKPSKSEKEAGCESIGPKRWCDDEGFVDIPQKRNKAQRHNYHPTVKPVKLMAYLATLGSRPRDVVMDPFLGSGSTAIACELQDRKWIGIELEREYAEIAAARISNVGLNFRARKLEDISIDIRARDIFSTEDYGIHRRANGLYLKAYAPITSIESLKIDGVSVTPSKIVVDYDRLILGSDAEVSSWPVGRSKAKASFTYGYPKGSRESILASEFATLYVSNKLYESRLKLSQRSGATKVTHASVVFENDTVSEEAISRKEIELRMKLILEHLPKKLRGVLG